MHVRTQTGEKPHKWAECDCRSVSLLGFKKHANTQVIKPFGCKQCGYITAFSGSKKVLKVSFKSN